MGADLENFVDCLYQDTVGYVYCPVKEENGSWGTFFTSWPSGRNYLLDRILTLGETKDIFIAPAMFKDKVAIKAAVLGSHVAWSEVDGTPIQWGKYKIPEPSMTVQSSSPTHLHFYWLMDGFYDASMIEKLNRAITYAHEFDPSCWDSTQVLRPPETFNHKKGKNKPPVFLLDFHPERICAMPEFKSVPEVFTGSDAPDPGIIPSVYEVISRVQFSEAAKIVMSKDPSTVDDRSKHLMHLAYLFHESGLAQNQIVTMLAEADSHLGKFANRPNRLQLLNDIAYKAMQKPLPIQVTIKDKEKKHSGTIGRTLKAFMAEPFKFEKIFDFIYPGSISLVVGSPGIGKTSQMLFEAFRLSAATDKKIIFFSMEMNEAGLQQFCKVILPQVPEANQENIIIYAPGIGVSLDEIEEQIETFNPDGIYVDSLSSIMTKFDEENSLKFLNWLMSFTGDEKFSVVIHHTRKRDPKDDPSIDDTYGSVFIAAKASVIRELYDKRWIITKDRYGTMKNKSIIALSPFGEKEETSEPHSDDPGTDGPGSDLTKDM